MNEVQHIAGHTYHGRKGDIANAFRYSVDYVLLDMEREMRAPRLFSRNRGNLTALYDGDHGGVPKAGTGAAWVRSILEANGLDCPGSVQLLAQPRVLGHVFNPVCFWLCHDADAQLCVVIAEVTNTYGDRHSYLCHHDDLRPILPSDRLKSRKLMHVSPFQPVEGGYEFRFDITPARIGVVIDYTSQVGGLIATLTGPCAPLTNSAILRFCLRRPFGSRRVLTLIHWQALKLWWKGAGFKNRPEPPASEVS
ncbi:DUF1365 domain-containing protein [Planktotalea arctica]|uniref:DUF1365 domain-containing protein n=1 Tax=Planktotalea arctica TaxID=1481893 RepID=UPI000A174E02|nr:DUF1365 domain-containing protein [Planktotalea arctica]